MLLNFLNKKVNPLQQLFHTNIIISIDKQYTSADPCKNLYHYAESLSKIDDILYISVILGFPYADVYEMGSSIIVISNSSVIKGEEIGLLLKTYIINARDLFQVEKSDLESVLHLIKKYDKPVLLLDMGDNIGGGASGNSTTLLKILENSTEYKSFVCLNDSIAVLNCQSSICGESFILSMGADPAKEDSGLTTEVTLLGKYEGKFKEVSPRHGGQVNFNMGQTAVVKSQKGNVIMLTSLRTPPFSLNQLTSCHLNPRDFDVIVAKGVNAPIAAYAPVCKHIFQVDTPGVTQANIKKFQFNNRRKPLYPFEEIEG